MIHLNVLLPRNRNSTGWLRVERDGVPLCEFRVLGRGSRGPGDTSLLIQGNTPTGEYRGSFEETMNRSVKSYGPWGAVRLKPVSGEAVLAEDIFGRRGLLIHGGSLGGPGYWRGKASLRATYGCLRLSNGDMQSLRRIIEAEQYDEKRKICREPDIEISVNEC